MTSDPNNNSGHTGEPSSPNQNKNEDISKFPTDPKICMVLTETSSLREWTKILKMKLFPLNLWNSQAQKPKPGYATYSVIYLNCHESIRAWISNTEEGPEAFDIIVSKFLGKSQNALLTAVVSLVKIKPNDSTNMNHYISDLETVEHALKHAAGQADTINIHNLITAFAILMLPPRFAAIKAQMTASPVKTLKEVAEMVSSTPDLRLNCTSSETPRVHQVKTPGMMCEHAFNPDFCNRCHPELRKFCQHCKDNGNQFWKHIAGKDTRCLLHSKNKQAASAYSATIPGKPSMEAIVDSGCSITMTPNEVSSMVSSPVSHVETASG